MNNQWFEVITEEGDWCRFDELSDAKTFFYQLVKDGEEVTLMKPTQDWSEDFKDYETLEDWTD